MKKTGYKPEFAAAVEASSSTGGQVMPPILGAAAFIMAEITGIPYLTIAVAAIIPALLYFTGVFVMVHLEAKKTGLKGLPKETLPKFGRLLLSQGYLFLPIVVLIVLLSRGFTPSLAACGAILSVFIVTFFKKETRFTPHTFIEAIAAGSRNTLGVGIACAVAGTIVGIVTLTGIGQMLIRLLVVVVNNPFLVSINASLFVALIITAVACLILGLGVPTTAKYVIMATITAPMILRAGAEIGIVVPLLAAHMFVFHFGTDADITPPVGLAAYAGAAIAKSNPILTCVIAAKLAIAGYILPFFFVFNPELLFIGATPLVMIKILISSMLGMFAIALGVQGYLLRKIPVFWRLLAATAGFLLIDPGLVTDIIGFTFIALLVAIQIIQKKQEKTIYPLTST
jgi:TRAP transporter 4TM/12TM fusion protein